MDGAEGRTNVTTPLPAQSQTPSVPDLPTTVDDDTLWRALAEVAQVRACTIFVCLLAYNTVCVIVLRFGGVCRCYLNTNIGVTSTMYNDAL